MKANHSLTALGLTSLLALACTKEPSYDAAAGRDDDTPRGAATELGVPPITAAAAHHADHPSAVAPGTNPAATTVTGALRPDEGTGRRLEAEAKFQSVPEMKIEGDAELEEVAEGVRIEVEVEHAPAGQKGIHIHQTDNCSDIANKSMGEHFAPTSTQHGLPGAPQHHLGDLGNITIGQNGEGKLEITVAGANLKPNDPLSLIGKSIVIHESNDKGTGPSGDSGKPIACAPIRAD